MDQTRGGGRWRADELAGVIAAAAVFVVLDLVGLLGNFPVFVPIGLVVLTKIAERHERRRRRAGGSPGPLQLRAFLPMILASLVVWSGGWMPLLPAVLMILSAQAIEEHGSSVWRSAAAYGVVMGVLGQAAIAAGWLGSRVGTPLVYVATSVGLVCAVLFTQVLARTASRRERAELALRAEEERFRSLVQHAFDIIITTDVNGVFTYVSPSIRDALGYEPEELVGTQGSSMIHPDDRHRLAPALAVLTAEPDGTLVEEIRIRHRDGRYRWFELQCRNLLHRPEVAAIVINQRDITERRAWQEQLRHQASHDALTGLPNRPAFLAGLADAVERRSAAAGTIAVLFVDLNGFKDVNDALGHNSGDVVLREVAVRLQRCVRPQDVVARLAGDEFTVLLDGLEDEHMAQRIADRIEAEIARPILINDREVLVGASVGLACNDTGQETPDLLLHAADVAMYREKHTAGATGRRNSSS